MKFHGQAGRFTSIARAGSIVDIEQSNRGSVGGDGHRVSKPSKVIEGIQGLTPEELFDQAGEIK